MRYRACRANNWAKNDYPIGETGYCVIFEHKGEVTSIKWFPDELFYRVFGEDLVGTF